MREPSDPSGTPDIVDPRLGKVLEDRYRIVRLIGRGGMGAVYEGEHLLIKRRVAIKCLHADLASNPTSVERFKREALAAASIGHPHIIDVTDMGRFEDGAVFMVLEYLEGRPWSVDLEERGAQPVDKVVHVVTQICDGLGAAHDKSIVHRDLKPENIFLIRWKDDPDFVKLLDFGIAKILDDAPGTRGITKTGSVIGTPHYMAPEQLEGKKDIDHRSDIFSMGVMIFQALTGQLPFSAASLPLLIVDIIREPPPPLEHYRPDLPEELASFVESMLSKDPALRPASCAAVASELARFATIDDAPVVNAEPWRSPPETSATMMETGPTVAAEDESEAAATGTATVPEVPATRSKLRWVLASLAVVVIAGLAAGLLIGVSRTSGSTRDDAPDAASPRAAEKTVAAATDEEQAFVALEVRTDPPSAELVLDGHAVVNPYLTELPATTKLHRLEASAPGHETVVKEFVLTKARRLQIALPAVEAADAGASSPSAPAKRAPSGISKGAPTKTRDIASRDAGAPRETPPPEPAKTPQPATKSQPPAQPQPEEPPVKRLKFKEVNL